VPVTGIPFFFVWAELAAVLAATDPLPTEFVTRHILSAHLSKVRPLTLIFAMVYVDERRS
jgi:hypothetical protein